MYRVVCDGLPDVNVKGLKYARSIRDNHTPGRCHVEELVNGEWKEID